MNAATQALKRLPRDARDTLFLLAVIASVSLPHWFYLPLWCSALSAVVIFWRGFLAWRSAPLPGRWTVVLVLCVVLGLTTMSHGNLIGREPGLTLAVSLLALKTLELRARRDAFVVFFFGFFLLLAQFLRSQSLVMALGALISVWGLLTGLVLAHMPLGSPALSLAARYAARMALMGTPIMIALFLVFPRIGPLWGVPGADVGGTGLSNSMRMGSMAEIALDDSIALRLRFFGPRPNPQGLYFRGPVLADFDGQQWRPLRPRFDPTDQPMANLQLRGPVVEYEMTAEPSSLSSLPLLEATDAITTNTDPPLVRTTDLQWVRPAPMTERARLRATAHLSFAHGPQEYVLGLQDYIELPAGYNPRTLQWAADLRNQPELANASAQVLAGAVLHHIRTAGFSYTLAPGLYGVDNPTGGIDEFWLDRRRGFCEHFASAFVVVMRAMDVPARVVTGFLGADDKETDGFTVVRNSAAHAWAEYWQPGVGWIRADPTAAVAPERVERNQRLRAAPGPVAQVLAQVDPQTLMTLRLGWEAVNNRWNQWVLNYSSTQQFNLLRDVGFDAPSWETLAQVFAFGVAGVTLLGIGVSYLQARRVPPWQRELRKWRQATARLGLQWADHEGPLLIAERLQSRFHTAAPAPTNAQACETPPGMTTPKPTKEPAAPSAASSAASSEAPPATPPATPLAPQSADPWPAASDHSTANGGAPTVPQTVAHLVRLLHALNQSRYGPNPMTRPDARLTRAFIDHARQLKRLLAAHPRAPAKNGPPSAQRFPSDS